MMTRIAFYFVFYPLSLLPLWALYGLSNLMYIILYGLVGYRKAVVRKNLNNSFPNLSGKELLLIEKKYYKHLCDLFVESIKSLTMSKQQLMKRYRCLHPEIVNKYFEQGKSVILLSAHYNNWEWMVLSLSLQFHHHGIGVGKANSNKVFELLINRARTRYGTEVVFADTVRETFAQYDQQHKLCAYMMLSDQSPASVKKSFVTEFLHQPSAMIYGGEYFAKKYNYPVLYYAVKKVKRGYYEIEIKPITDTPQEEAYGKIVQTYVSYLQNDIETCPAYWLWSHRRWKHQIPAE